jgi:hypothetical protein
MKDTSDSFAYGKIPDLTDPFLNSLTASLDGPGVIGLALGGSYARNDATSYSDIDIALVMREDTDLPPKRFILRDDKLVSVSPRHLSAVRTELTRPQRAIWIVPGLSVCRILIDKTGALAEFLTELRTFQWAPLQPDADRYAAGYLTFTTEEAFKVLGALQRDNNHAVAEATSTLISSLTHIIAVQRGVMITSNYTYYQQVQASVGPESIWTAYHNLATGVTAPDVPSAQALSTRALSSLHLFRETLDLIKHTLTREQLDITKQIIRYTGARTPEQNDF